MRLFEEIFGEEEAQTARCTLYVGGGGYFQGVKAVGDFCSERIVLYFPRGSVEINGIDLAIGKYCDGDLRLVGKVQAIRFYGKEGVAQ